MFGWFSRSCFLRTALPVRILLVFLVVGTSSLFAQTDPSQAPAPATASPQSTSSQPAPAQAVPTSTTVVSVNEVSVNMVVRDKKGKLVPDLKPRGYLRE